MLGWSCYGIICIGVMWSWDWVNGLSWIRNSLRVDVVEEWENFVM